MRPVAIGRPCRNRLPCDAPLPDVTGRPSRRFPRRCLDLRLVTAVTAFSLLSLSLSYKGDSTRKGACKGGALDATPVTSAASFMD